MATRTGVHMTYTWVPDPVVFADRMFAVAEGLENTALPLLYAKEQTQADIRSRFETETDPSGKPWKEWSESYLPVAEAYPNEGILRRTDELMEAAVDDNAFIVTNDAVFYNAENIPERGIWHQEGRPGRMRGGDLPKREFLGVSMVAQGMIFRAFGEWFDGVTDLFITARGRIGRRHILRGAGGRFVPNA
jgi:phage gpG-like protein